MDTPAQIPARRVLAAASAANARSGHENLGSLSLEHGFLPAQPPLGALPASHRAWDALAEQLPQLYRTQRIRRALEALEELPADAESLPHAYLLRASALLSILAHAYHRGEATPPATLPGALHRPWEEVTQRLGRRTPVLSYIDLILYNWRLLDPTCAEPRRVENMALLIPTVDNPEERIFYLTQVEIMARCAPLVGAVVRAQEAVGHDDPAALGAELSAIAECLYTVAGQALVKIDPNPSSRLYVDPVVWAKTVAPFAVPIFEGVQGPSGTSAPIFHMLDLFFGRRDYRSTLGQETMHLRAWYPPHWQAFLEAVGVCSVRDYVEQKGDRALAGRFGEAINAYAGEDGFLGRHRLKVYGYLELAFKVGRSTTIGGFTGLFRDRAWDKVDDELEQSRRERPDQADTHWTHAIVRSIASSPLGASTVARHVVLDVRRAGLSYRPGDRCQVLPENMPPQIARTLVALRADGGELVGLNMAWREAIAAREGYAGMTELPLRDLLRFGHIRPLARPIARALYRATGNEALRRITEARAADQWELWDLLELLSASGFDPRSLWRAHPSDHESICWIVPPLRPRLYSIASVLGEQTAEELHLTVGGLRYETMETDISRRAERFGTASSYLMELAEGQRVTIKLVRPPRFGLPADPTRPIVMIAGGTGLAPFRSFILARARQAEAGPAWLFFATRSHDELYYAGELAQHVADRRLNIQVAFSREDSAARFADDDEMGARLVLESCRRRRIDELLLQPDNAALLSKLLSRDTDGAGAIIYICGRAGFAASVQRAIRALLTQPVGGEAAEHARSAALHFRALVAEGRYREEVYTSYAGPAAQAPRQIDASELVLHNDVERDAWIAISGRVYDMTEFLHLHPGGLKILQANLGMDATHAYRQVQHHVRPEVDALLTIYAIGVVRRLDFGAAWAIVIGEQGPRFTGVAETYKVWARVLYLVVEMENALRLDFTIQQRALVGGEPAAGRSPYKYRLVLEIHQRFLANCLRGLAGEPLHELWAIACALGGQDHDIGWMRQALDATMQGQAAESTNDLVSILEDAIRDESDAERDSQVAETLGALECADLLFLQELKLAVREGLRVFETYQREVAPQGGALLLDICRRLPELYALFFARAAQVLVQSGARRAKMGRGFDG